MFHSLLQNKWVALLELTFLGLCLLAHHSDAHVLVYRRITSQLIEEYNDMPAQFGPPLPSNGLKVFIFVVSPLNGCTKISPVPDDRHKDYPPKSKFVAIIERGGTNCTFEMKVRNAQEAGFAAVVVFNNNSDDLEQMSAQNSSGIYVPSVFVGQTAGKALLSLELPDVVLVINDELPFNINTQLILPFSILIGLCFLIMIFYMIYKCIREERRLRRYRLPKRMLKKLPILKYTKNNTDLAYETCVICLDDFVEGDKLRVLPCRHPYHSHCIDPWLTENSRVCPVCKRKVFTKREARQYRTSNRQSSLDSVTDTDDDTTPLLQPSSNSNGGAVSTAALAGTPNTSGGAATDLPSTTRHGTFRRLGGVAEVIADGGLTSDDENVLTDDPNQHSSSSRVNPFDRSPNLPAHLAEQLSEDAGSSWLSRVFRSFRRPHAISIAAPPFLEEVIHEDPILTGTLPPAPPTAPAAVAISNNIMNPNLSGSFKDDDDLPHQSLYEPINTVTPTAAGASTRTTTNSSSTPIGATAGNENFDTDSVFIQTPTRGGIGVVALPNEMPPAPPQTSSRNRLGFFI